MCPQMSRKQCASTRKLPMLIHTHLYAYARFYAVELTDSLKMHTTPHPMRIRCSFFFWLSRLKFPAIVAYIIYAYAMWWGGEELNRGSRKKWSSTKQRITWSTSHTKLLVRWMDKMRWLGDWVRDTHTLYRS